MSRDSASPPNEQCLLDLRTAIFLAYQPCWRWSAVSTLEESLNSGGGDDAISHVCEGSAPEGGTGCTGPWNPKGGRCHRPLTNVGYKLERGPEVRTRPRTAISWHTNLTGAGERSVL